MCGTCPDEPVRMMYERVKVLVAQSCLAVCRQEIQVGRQAHFEIGL